MSFTGATKRRLQRLNFFAPIQWFVFDGTHTNRLYQYLRNPSPLHSNYESWVDPYHPLLTKPPGEGIFVPFHQARGYSPINGECCAWESNYGGGYAPDQPSPNIFTPPIFRDKRKYSPSFGDPACNEIVVKETGPTQLGISWDTKEKHAQFRSRRVWSRHHRTCQKPTPEQIKLPIHTPNVTALDLNTLMQWMTSAVKERFDEIWKLLISPTCNNRYTKFSPISKSCFRSRLGTISEIKHYTKGRLQRIKESSYERRGNTFYNTRRRSRGSAPSIYLLAKTTEPRVRNEMSSKCSNWTAYFLRRENSS